MSSEQPRDETGRFAPVAADSAPATGVTDGQQQAQPEPKYTVPVDGQQVEVGLGELLKGYMRQATFTKRSQELKAERERLSGGLQPGLQVPQQGYGQGDPFHGGRVGSAGVSPRVGQEQPAYGTPAYGQPPAPPVAVPGDEDYVDGKTFRYTTQQITALQQEVVRMRQEVEYQAYERQQESAISSIPARIPGFNRAEVDEAINLQPEFIQADYARMPRAAAYELAYHRLVAPRKTAAVQTQQPQAAQGSQTTGTPAAFAPPYGADVRGSAVGTESPLDLRKVNVHDPASLAAFVQKADKAMSGR